MPLRSLE